MADPAANRVPPAQGSAISYAHPAALRCPSCKTEFDAALWVLVDASEHPELISAIREGSVHRVVCPACAHGAIVDTALLLYRPSDHPKLILTRPDDASDDQFRRHTAFLVSRLRAGLGSGGPGTWDESDLAVVPKSFVGDVIDRGWGPVRADLERAERRAAIVHAIAYLNDRWRASLNRPDLIRSVIAGWTKLLAVDEVLADPLLETAVVGNLANAWLRDYEVTGQPIAAREAESRFEWVLARPHQVEPTHWANAQHGLANLRAKQYERTGDAAHFRDAVGRFRAALAARPRETLPRDWAMTQHGLGNLFAARYELTGSADDAVLAETHYAAALEEYHPDDAPGEWAAVQHGLAVLFALVHDDGADDHAFRRACAHHADALRVRTRAAAPSDWAMEQNGLGSLYARRFEHSRDLADAEDAEHHYRAALEVYDPVETPLDWVATEHGLGNLWLTQYEQTRVDAHARRAATHYRRALHALDRRTMPTQWALAQQSLANLQAKRYARTGGRWLADDAACRYAKATTVWRRTTSPVDWAAVQHAVGNLAIDRYARGEGDRWSRLAERRLRAAATAARNSSGVLTILAQQSLGALFARRFERERRLDDCRRSARYYRRVLRAAGTRALPGYFAYRAAAALLRVSFLGRDWAAVATAHARVEREVEALLRLQGLRASRETWLAESQGLAQRAAYALARKGSPARAVVVLERSRARLLSQSLARHAFDVEALRVAQPDLAARVVAARERLRALEATDLARLDAVYAAPRRDLSAALTAARAELDAALSEVTRVPGFGRVRRAIRFAAVRAAAEPPIVYLAATPAGGVALHVDRRIGADAAWLPALTDAAVVGQLRGDGAEAGGFLGAYARTRRPRAGVADRRAWSAALDATCGWLWTSVMEPVLTRLRAAGTQAAVLVPTGLLGALPLHAAWTADPDASTGRRYALDACAFSYAPNASALAAARRRARTSHAESLLLVVEPQPVFGPRLPGASAEARAVAAFWPSDAPAAAPWRTDVWHHAADVDRVLAELPRHGVLHYVGHAFAGWEEPLDGGLVLAEDRVLTVRALYTASLGLRLAVLSGCETGVLGLLRPDEAVSLPAALLDAGAAAVLASLWAVHDASTAQLMERFHTEWRRGQESPPEALRRAQRWLRDEAGRPHPIHWAAFTLTGA